MVESQVLRASSLKALLLCLLSVSSLGVWKIKREQCCGGEGAARTWERSLEKLWVSHILKSTNPILNEQKNVFNFLKELACLKSHCEFFQKTQARNSFVK